MLPNSIYGALFPLFAMFSDRKNAYNYAVLGNSFTFTASILFAVKRTPSSVRTARILMSVGESMLLPQGLRFAGYHSPPPIWARILASWLYGVATVELNVVGIVGTNALLEHPDASFYICIGISGFSFVILIARLPVLGFSRQWWRFWTPLLDPLQPMEALSADEQSIVDKIVSKTKLTRTEEESLRHANMSTATLLLYAQGWLKRHSFFMFDYTSACLIGVSLFFSGFAFGALAFTGVGLSNQAKNLSDAYQHLTVYLFLSAIFATACGVSGWLFRTFSYTTFIPDKKIVPSERQITFTNNKLLHDDYHIDPLPSRPRLKHQSPVGRNSQQNISSRP